MKYDIAIVGGGFCGLLVLHHLVEKGPRGALYAIFEPRPSLGEGLAYSTRNPSHLLNVPAKNMSALATEPDHFLQWLSANRWEGDKYVPRALYALYLQDIARNTYELAKRKEIVIHHIRQQVENLDPLADASYQIFCKETCVAQKVVLALGNISREASASLIQDVWNFDYSTLRNSRGPIAMIGSGLTMVDVLLSLRDAGYSGKVTAISRHGFLPQAHSEVGFSYSSKVKELVQLPQPFSLLFQRFRGEIQECIEQCHLWQPVYESWRSYLSDLWRGLNLKEQKRFLKLLYPFWSVHRHRMAKKIGDFVVQECRQGKLEVKKGTSCEAEMGFDCRGPAYKIDTSSNVLVKNLLSRGLIRQHATGWGIAVNSRFQAECSVKKNPPFIVGPLLIGEYLESTAIPELRNQTLQVASCLLAKENHRLF